MNLTPNLDPRQAKYTAGDAGITRPNLFERLLLQLNAASHLVVTSLRQLAISIRLTISERRLILAVLDVLILNAALLATLATRAHLPLTWHAIQQVRGYFILLTLLWAVWATFFDCYDLVRIARGSQSAWCAGRAGLLTSLSYLAIPMVTPGFPSSRLTSLVFLVLATASVLGWRLLYAAIFSQPIFQQRVIVVGAGNCGRAIARMLSSLPSEGNPYAGSGYYMTGFVDDDPAKLDTTVEGMPVLGTCADLPELVRHFEVDLIVVAITHPSSVRAEVIQSLLDCRECSVSVESMTSVYERLTGRVPVEHAGRDLSVVMPPSDMPMQHLFGIGKRSIDLVGGVCGMAALVVLVPLVAIANCILCPGPLFYRQVRVGRGGRRFWVYKFRSMIPAAEQHCGAVWSTKGDKRITPVGRVLRATRLDELPQFLNVLKGDMSLIGPRPERPEFVAKLAREVPFYQARHAVKPGITGWAQVRYRYGCTEEDSLVKLQYDLYYIKHQSLYLELSILVKTVAVMLGLKGR